MNELKGEFLRRTLHTAETNTDLWFEELFFKRCRLEEEYQCKTFGDVEMMNQIYYNTKPAVYQMQLTVIWDQLIKEPECLLKYSTYVHEETLETPTIISLSPSIQTSIRQTHKVLLRW
jgi:hypothetical protein